MNNQKLIIEQLDKKFTSLGQLKDFIIPLDGWVSTIRTALKMSLAQLGKRMGISAPAVIQIEEREKSGSVSLNVLRKVGEVLNMKFIYGFIPERGTLAKIDRKSVV